MKADSAFSFHHASPRAKQNRPLLSFFFPQAFKVRGVSHWTRVEIIQKNVCGSRLNGIVDYFYNKDMRKFSDFFEGAICTEHLSIKEIIDQSSNDDEFQYVVRNKKTKFRFDFWRC